MTLRPGVKALEERIRIFNPTPYVQLYYFWNCTAVPNTPGFRFIYPMTLGFPYGCGRVLYTTYHTVGEMSGPHAGLEVQERILVYLIMEIGVCQSGPILE